MRHQTDLWIAYQFLQCAIGLPQFLMTLITVPDDVFTYVNLNI
jgi:hypothetical protein